MNISDLRAELHRQADDPPDRGSVLADVDASYRTTTRRRRRTTLLAAAASVVVVVVGVGLAVNAVRPGDPAPVVPPAPTQVPTPIVVLPPDTQLQRFDAPAVTSPVDATAPGGLTHQGFTRSPGVLSVSYFAAPTTGPDGSPIQPLSAGYVITAEQHPATFVPGEEGLPAVSPASTPTTVNGRPATLSTAPEGALDAWGMPAERRISWQLSDGRWIHVWGQGTSGRDLATELAETIVEVPTELPRTLDVGVTLPGLTSVAEVDSTLIGPSSPVYSYQCRTGYDPFASTQETSTGSGSAGPDDETVTYLAGSTEGLAPCLVVTAVVSTLDQFGLGEGATPVETASGTVWVESHSAVRDLGNGVIVLLGLPAGVELSQDDLVAAALSVWVSPTVTVSTVGPPLTPDTVGPSSMPSAQTSPAPTG